MSSSRSWSGTAALAFATIVVWGLGGSAQGGAGPEAVYVVAVKDSGVLTMCPALREATMANGRMWKSDGRANVVPFSDDLQLLRFPPRESPLDLRVDPRLRTELGGTQTILPVPMTAVAEASSASISAGTELGRDIMAIDPALRQTVERELAKLRTHEVADSVEEADVALLIEGTYIALAAAISSDAGSIPSDVGQAPPPLGLSMQSGCFSRCSRLRYLSVLTGRAQATFAVFGLPGSGRGRKSISRRTESANTFERPG